MGAALSIALAGAGSADDATMRASARARGSDRPTAIVVGRSLIGQGLPAQVTRVRCEKLGGHRICGVVLSGVKFKRPIDQATFVAEIRAVVRTAFAVAPLEEVDVWVTVPLSSGTGVAVSGDAAVATAATVFAISVPRSRLARLDDQLANRRDLFWDASFADSLARGPHR